MQKTKAVGAIALLMLSILCNNAYGKPGNRLLSRWSAKVQESLTTLQRSVPQTLLAGVATASIACGAYFSCVGSDAFAFHRQHETSASVAADTVSSSDDALLIVEKDSDLAKLLTALEQTDETTAALDADIATQLITEVSSGNIIVVENLDEALSLVQSSLSAATTNVLRGQHEVEYQHHPAGIILAGLYGIGTLFGGMYLLVKNPNRFFDSSIASTLGTFGVAGVSVSGMMIIIHLPLI